jgi:hypothetical protein
VEHHRRHALAVGADVADVEPVGQHQIELDRPALPGAPRAIGDGPLQLRAVERARPRLDHERHPQPPQHRLQRRFGPIPRPVVAGALGRARGQRQADVVEAERPVERGHRPAEAQHLLLGLRLRTENVAVVLRELPQAQQAVQRAARLVPVHLPQLGQPQGQLAVRRRPARDQVHVPRAAHRFDRRRHKLVLHAEQPRLEVLPVTARLPHRTPEQLRRLHLGVAVGARLPSRRLLQQPQQREAVRVPEHHPRRLVLEMQQIQPLREVSMIVILFGA